MKLFGFIFAAAALFGVAVVASADAPSTLITAVVMSSIAAVGMPAPPDPCLLCKLAFAQCMDNCNGSGDDCWVNCQCEMCRKPGCFSRCNFRNCCEKHADTLKLDGRAALATFIDHREDANAIRDAAWTPDDISPEELTPYKCSKCKKRYRDCSLECHYFNCEYKCYNSVCSDGYCNDKCGSGSACLRPPQPLQRRDDVAIPKPSLAGYGPIRNSTCTDLHESFLECQRGCQFGSTICTDTCLSSICYDDLTVNKTCTWNFCGSAICPNDICQKTLYPELFACKKSCDSKDLACQKPCFEQSCRYIPRNLDCRGFAYHCCLHKEKWPDIFETACSLAYVHYPIDTSSQAHPRLPTSRLRPSYAIPTVSPTATPSRLPPRAEPDGLPGPTRTKTAITSKSTSAWLLPKPTNFKTCAQWQGWRNYCHNRCETSKCEARCDQIACCDPTHPECTFSNPCPPCLPVVSSTTAI
ncbi:hypothetical protein P154DRAFT_601542 [Amniculicola lignicola CBS 123094]|uniref:Uncharacterized protein n=1 Tax=Amniculicola lignicola CBS 123094 TaxID=1392246 RepID=A0A6A5WF50_9PLEO|nr:hypothetical protein P154DRAFT_601542 [Amniculicola lignicola CBS 123094]